VLAARSNNVSNDTVEKAILRGTGELEGVEYEEIVYEGYGPNGIALMVEVLTDNKNRAISEIRYIMSRNGGNIGARGCVSWMFEKKGLIVVDKEGVDEETVFAVALESGAEDLYAEPDHFEITTAPDNFHAVRDAVEEAGFPITMAELTMVPQNTVKLTDEKEARQMLRLMEALEDNDDVQKVYANFDIPDEIMENAA